MHLLYPSDNIIMIMTIMVIFVYRNINYRANN